MDIFEERYFIFNKKLFFRMGLWPFGLKTKNIRKYLLLFIQFLLTLPHLISVAVNFSNVDRVMLNLVVFLILFSVLLKVLSLIIAESEMKGLYRNIADNWLAMTDETEKKILIKYSEVGRKKAICYFAFVQIGTWSIFALPTILKILDIISPLTQPRQSIHILEGELFIDRDTCYMSYYFLDVISIIISATVNVSIDTMYIVCVEHCCGLYAILRYRLRNLKSETIKCDTRTEVDPSDYISGIIRLHQNTLNFTGTVNEAYSMLFLYISFVNIIVIPLLAVTVLSNLDEPYNCIRFGMLFILVGTHLFMLFWPGQNVLDEGTGLIDDAYCNEWYTTSLQSRKMIIILMIRCSRPALLAAGGLILMNFESLSTIIRTAVSYITVVASFR